MNMVVLFAPNVCASSSYCLCTPFIRRRVFALWTLFITALFGIIFSHCPSLFFHTVCYLRPLNFFLLKLLTYTLHLHCICSPIGRELTAAGNVGMLILNFIYIMVSAQLLCFAAGVMLYRA